MDRHRSSPNRQVTPSTFRQFTLAALAAQVVIVLSGVAVRLTGSGLGCSDWPGCTEDRLVAPLELNPMIEFINRCVSFVVIATVALAIWGALRRVPYRRDLLNWSFGLALGTAAQVILGAITVRTHLWPPIVMAHFLLSMVLIWNAVVLHHRATVSARGDIERDVPLGPTRSGASVVDTPVLTRLMNLLVVTAAAVLFTGTIVTGSGPHGGDENVERLGFYVPTVTRFHAGAVFVFVGLLVITLLVLRNRSTDPQLFRTGSTVLAVTLAQGAIGYYQYFNGVPILAVFFHVVGAMAMWGSTVWFVLEYRRLATAPAPAPLVPDHPLPAVTPTQPAQVRP